MPTLRTFLAPVLVLALGLVAAPSAAAEKPGALVAVIDAGSSGTRLTLFEQSTGVDVAQVFRAPTNTPGLSSFATNVSAAGPEAVLPLLDQLRDHLEAEGVAIGDVPVALLATAGMRRLKLNDPTAVRAILASTRATITASGFPLQANRILPDTQEALLAWLDANAGAGTLDTPSEDIGIVEVGGASAQVAFRSPRTSGPGISRVTVSGKDIHVVAISYLGLGANEARGFMQEAASGGEDCFPNNASGTDPVNFVATSNFPVPSAEADFRGFPCRRAYSGVIEQVAGLYPRALRPRNLASLPGFSRADFIGLGAIPFVYSDFRIPSGADDRKALQSAVRTDCKGANAWLTVRALVPAPTPYGQPSLAETLCSSGAYLDAFFFGRSGLGLDPATFDAQPDLPGGEPSWSAGYAITVLHP